MGGRRRGYACFTVVNPAIEWLSARLAKGSATPRDVMDEALALGVTATELLDAKRTLGVIIETRTPEAGGKSYSVWMLPPTPPEPREAQLVRADEVLDLPPSPKPTRHDPKAVMQRAKDRLARKAVRYVKGIEELSERIDRDPVKCPTCGRGTKRSEEIRLRALTAALDRAGVVAPRSGDAGEMPERGALIVFPPGTRIAILPEPLEPAEQPTLGTLRRADQVGT